MSVGTSKRKEKCRATAAEVEEFLRRHPDFFHDHLDLLETLEVPHPCGDAVSLISRQITLLRDESRRSRQQLNEILQVARDNDALHQRLHRLTLTLLDATGLEDALGGLRWGLREYFQADFVAVRIAEPSIDSPIADLALPPEHLESFAELMKTGEPICGKTDASQGAHLFGEQASTAASCALVPLRHAGLRGLLAIGSRDPSRFQSGMGLLFLARMGEIVSARLAALLDGKS